MKAKMVFDRFRRRQAAETEITRRALGYITHNDSLPPKTRMMAQFKLAEMPAYGSLVRMVRRCTITGRAKSVFEEFNINRMRFREMALKGLLLGVQKSSW